MDEWLSYSYDYKKPFPTYLKWKTLLNSLSLKFSKLSFLPVCLQHKDRVPYRRIKDYCLRVLDIREDHVKALTRAGMACYYLRELELSRFYLQQAKDYSHEPVGRYHLYKSFMYLLNIQGDI